MLTVKHYVMGRVRLKERKTTLRDLTNRDVRSTAYRNGSRFSQVALRQSLGKIFRDFFFFFCAYVLLEVMHLFSPNESSK